MLDLKSQSQLAEATADMMRACAVATARAATSSMFQSLSFWSRMLGPVPAFPASPWPAAWSYTGMLPTPQQNASPDQSPEPASQSAFASYRSAGGHAAAQVIVA